MILDVPRQVLAAAALAAAACAEPGPRPPAEAAPAFLHGESAVAQQAGVQVAASTRAWEGSPAALETELTPVLVNILNDSRRPVRIGYESFRFTSEAETLYSPLPPYRIEVEVVQPVSAGRPYYTYAGFRGAPYLRAYFPQVAAYEGSFAFDDGYYGAHAPAWSRYQSLGLPSEDMLARALPEGVLESGGRVGGFLYFPRLEGRGPFAFSFNLMDAESGVRIGVITMPFAAE